jgi:hypothetical protein
MKVTSAVIGAVFTLGVGVVGVHKYSEFQKELLRERAAREAEENKANLLAFEAGNARREESVAESARRRLELDAEDAELRRLDDQKKRAAGRTREELLAETARLKEARRRSRELERDQQLRDVEAALAASPWGKIRTGMTRDEVRQVLGKPKWLGGGAAGDTWMYLEKTTLGCGSITFLGGVVESFRDPFRCQPWKGWPEEWPGLNDKAQAAMAQAKDEDSGAPERRSFPFINPY